MVSSTTYVRFEVLRTFRNVRFFLLSLVFPLILFLAVAAANRHAQLGGVSFTLYYMVGMVTFGTMGAVLGAGGRIAQERSVNWTRQMRVTPLTTRTYFSTKVLSSYLMAACTMVVLYAAGLSFGVSLSVSQWLEMTGLLLVGLVPLAILGILMGHLLNPESIGPALGGGTALLALLGGAYGPLVTHGSLLQIIKLLPSYWLVEARNVGLGGHAWPAEAWIVTAVWTVLLLRITVRVYRRESPKQ